MSPATSQTQGSIKKKKKKKKKFFELPEIEFNVHYKYVDRKSGLINE
jgi:hypothetical protein